MGIDWNRGKLVKERVAFPLGQEREGWIWEAVKIDKRGRAHSPGVEGRTGKILRQEIYQCAFCKGAGEKPRGARCSVCKGKGQVFLKPPAVACAYCKGRGEEHPRSNITCTACRGKGFASVIEPIEQCPHCRGTGAEPTNKLPCIVCRGKGLVTAKEGESDTERRRVKALSQSTSSRKSGNKELVTTTRQPTGSEREVLETIQELGETNRAVIGRRMGISSAYVGHLCNSLIKSGFMSRTNGGLSALTQKGKEALRK